MPARVWEKTTQTKEGGRYILKAAGGKEGTKKNKKGRRSPIQVKVRGEARTGKSRKGKNNTERPAKGKNGLDEVRLLLAKENPKKKKEKLGDETT